MSKNAFLRYIISSSFALLMTASLCLYSFTVSFPPDILCAVTEPSAQPIIVLDAGHGGEDCGAIGVNGVFEKDLNLQMAFCLRDYLLAAGMQVEMTRTEDRLLYTEEQNVRGQRKINDLRNRLLFAQSYENAILVSLHMNNFSQASSSGTQVWYSKHDIARNLADSIQGEVKALLQPQNHRKTKLCDSSLYLLHRSTHPAVLVECGFLSNENECARLCDESYQKQLSFVLFCAIMKAVYSLS